MNLTKVIEAQSTHSGTLPSVLFNEIAEFTNANVAQLTFVDEIKSPRSILRSENFQYLIDGQSYAVINKFFK